MKDFGKKLTEYKPLLIENKGFNILKVEDPNQTGDVQLKMEISSLN